MSAFLYTNYRGDKVTVHSYSSGVKFDSCPRDYRLEKQDGYRRKGKKAALEFGKAFEAAIQFFHANGCKPGSGVDEAKRLWLIFKEATDLGYTDKEGSWADLYRAITDLMRLYELMLPSLPIREPVFQVNYKREVYPGTELAGLEHTAFIDIVSRASWVHPLLPRVTIPPGAAHRPLLLDVKTAGAAMGNAAEMLALDPQLRQYAWTSHIPDVAFLWAVKARHGSWDRGTSVTLLEDSEVFKAVEEATVIYVRKMDEEKQLPERIGIVRPADFREYEIAAKDKRGKALEAFKEEFVAARGALVPPESLTRCKLQFAATRITEEAMRDAGQDVGRQIVEIVNASKTGHFPQRPGVRFPNNRCVYCDKRGICTDNPKLVEQLLVQISPAVPAEPDWLDELEIED